jgi:ribosome-binding factor A
MSPDLKLATAYIMPLGGQDEAPVIAALERNRKILRQEVARRVNLKYAPELRFRRDETFDEAARIDALLRSERVQRDLDSAPDGEPEDEPGH